MKLIGQPAATDFIKPGYQEAIKQHYEYDHLLRLTAVYECPSDTPNGGQCLKTQYAYEADSNRTIGMKETLATWDGSWDF